MATHILITGSAGFIGSHVGDWLARRQRSTHIVGIDLVRAPVPPTSHCADVRDTDHLRRIAAGVRPGIVIHLAAKAEVVIPFEELGDLFATNVNGTINVLAAMHPDRVIFASSSAVYGNASGRAALARWSCVNPLGAYGMSKAAAELACSEWARKTGGVAVSLRFGNVIGKGCRGLIPYLVDHALQYPDASRPARLRGHGELVRDYVPVSHAARVIELAAEMPRRHGSSTILNVGSGRGTTNRAVAVIVQRVLRSCGWNLAMEFSEPVAAGEAFHLVLDTGATNRKLGLTSPSHAEVVEAIEQAVLDRLMQAVTTTAHSRASA